MADEPAIADPGAIVAIPPVLGAIILPRPPAPLALQKTEFEAYLKDVVMMTPTQIQHLISNGVSTAEDVAMLDNETLMSIPLAATPAMITMRLKTLKQWVDTAFDEAVGLPTGTLDIRRFNTNVCRELQRKISRKGGAAVTFKSSVQADVKDGIGTFNGKISNWKRAKRKFEAGLAQFKNENRILLSYVIRDDTERDAAIAAGGFAAQLYDAPMTGPTFLQEDNFRLYQVLIQWTSGGTAETYVDSYQATQHGRNVWMAMISTYEGADARNANIQETRTALEALRYEKDSHNFTFDDYCTKTITYNNDLTRYRANVDGRSQVSKFLQGITRSNLQSIKISITRDSRCKDSLLQAVSEFKDVYQTLVKSGNVHQTRAERRVASQTRDQNGRSGRGGGGHGGHGGRHGGRGRGTGRHFNRGGRGNGRGSGEGGRNGPRLANFIPQATLLDRLSSRERAMLLAGRAAWEAQGDTGNSTITTRSSSSTSSTAVEPATVTAATSTGIVVAAPTTGSGASGRFGQQGGNRNASASTTSASTGNQYYIDHDNVRRLCPVTEASARRQIGKQLSFQQPTDYAARKRFEIDTRADTFCAGQTFLLQEPTGLVVDVGGFHPSLPVLKDIPIGLAVTAYDLPSGETIILDVHQALFFGASMEHSLCQPNQFREHGLLVDDCPKQYTNGRSLHGMYIPDQDLHIPFELHGCLSYFPTRLPTVDESDTCRWIHMSGDGKWDPYSSHFAEAKSATHSHLTEHPRHSKITPGTFDADGFRIDGRYQGSVSRITNTPENIDLFIGAMSTQETGRGIDRTIGATSSKIHRSAVDAAELAARWGTGLNTAAQTLCTMTQRGYRYLHGNLDRRFRTRQNQLRRTLLKTAVYSDTVFSDTKSIRGFTCAQLFVTAEGFADGNVMTTKADAYIQLNNFCREHGIPDQLVTDMAGEETEGDCWKRVVTKENLIHQRTTEAYSPWQNKCEKEIGELKRHCMRISHRRRVPEKLWCFKWRYTLQIRQHIARSASYDRTPYESLKGETPDISALIEFDFYDYVKVRPPTGFPNDDWVLARWLGPADGVGQGLSYYVVKGNGQVIARSTVRPLLPDEWTSETEKTARAAFDTQMTVHIGAYDDDTIQLVENDEMEDPIFAPTDEDETAGIRPDSAENPPANDITAGPDSFIGAEIYLPHGDRNEIAKVMGQKRNSNGLYIGQPHRNPILDSRVFTVSFPDGDEMDIAYNTLTEHLFSQVDEEGNQYRLFKAIVGHRKTKRTVDKADQYRINNGKRTKKQTTADWGLEVEWADGTTSWLPLKELKESNSVETAQYAHNNRIIEEPAFDWWAAHVLSEDRD